MVQSSVLPNLQVITFAAAAAAATRVFITQHIYL